MRIESYERLNNSVNANPRYRVFTDEGVYITSSDTSASYEVPDNVGKCVRFDLTQAGRITKIHPLEDPEYDDGYSSFDYDAALIALRQIGN